MRLHAIAVLVSLAFAPVYAQQTLNPPLRNWAAPLYWAPTPAEAAVQNVMQRIEQRVAHPDASPQIVAAGIFTPPGPMTFIAVTPCRVMDTRSTQPFTGAFGPPSLAANLTRSVPMPSSTTCTIPSNAGAYSLNITVVPPGPLSFLSVWPMGAAYPGVSTLNDPIAGGVIANAAIVVAGTSGAIQMLASNPTDVIIDINGYYAAPTDGLGNTGVGAGTLLLNTTGSGNTATGYGALQLNTTGSDNTASGDGAMVNNTTGSYNTASGDEALFSNTTGQANTATGYSALFQNTTGQANTADGYEALQSNTTGSQNSASGQQALRSNTTGSQNTATGVAAMLANTGGGSNTANGYQALFNNTTGCCNTAIGLGAMQYNGTGSANTVLGDQALVNNTGGSNNIAIGYESALNVSGNSFYNIHIGSEGVISDGVAANSGVIRIGTAGQQTSFFAAGVSGTATGLTGAVPVVIDANGQLGTVNSSQRFKEDIQDMGDTSSGLMQLRPVTFRYKQPYQDGSKPIDYGLIAEEVAGVYPDLVAYSPSGEVQTVQYQKINAMLLNEVQKQHQQIQDQKEEMSAEISALKAHLSELEKQIEALAGSK
jgi:Chaperone of endosialidase